MPWQLEEASSRVTATPVQARLLLGNVARDQPCLNSSAREWEEAANDRLNDIQLLSEEGLQQHMPVQLQKRQQEACST